MKLGIRARAIELPDELRGRIESRLRLSIGTWVGEVEAVQLTIAGSDRPGVSCELALRCLDGERLAVEERASDASGAIDLALWRLRHWRRRKELR